MVDWWGWVQSVCDWLKLRALTVEKFRARVEEQQAEAEREATGSKTLPRCCLSTCQRDAKFCRDLVGFGRAEDAAQSGVDTARSLLEERCA